MASRRVLPIYSKVKRISLYPQHSELLKFFAEIDLLRGHWQQCFAAGD